MSDIRTLMRRLNTEALVDAFARGSLDDTCQICRVYLAIDRKLADDWQGYRYRCCQ